MLGKILNDFFILICQIRLHIGLLDMYRIKQQLDNVIEYIDQTFQNNTTIAKDMRYCLMAAMDEAILSHPQASQAAITQPFVTQDFNDGHYGINTFKIMSQLKHYPESLRKDVAGVYFLIVSLGFSGEYQNNPIAIKQLCEHLFKDCKQNIIATSNQFTTTKPYKINLVITHMLISGCCFYYYRIHHLAVTFVQQLNSFIRSHHI